MTIRAAILSLLLLGTLAADQVRIDWRNTDTGNFAPRNLTTLPGYVITFDAAGEPVIGAATGGISDGDKGDITVSGSGATWAVDAGAISLAKLADLAQSKLIGRWTASTGVPETITIGSDFLTTAGTLSIDAAIARDSEVSAAIAAAVAGYQPLDADLTDLGGLTAAQGDIVIGNGAGDWAKLAKGTANQVLRMNAGATLPEWATMSAGGSVATDAIWDAAGDLAVGSGADTAVKLARGSALQVLRVNAGGTNLEWAAAAGGGVAISDSPTWTGSHIHSTNGAADTPAIRLTGTPFLGTATTSKPLLLVEPAGTTSTGWTTTGTMLGVNAATGFTGNLIEAQLNGVGKFRLATDGTLKLANGLWLSCNTAFSTRVIDLYGYAPWLSFSNNGAVVWENGATIAGTPDVALFRLGAANLRLGEAPSASPIAQTFTIGEASRPGTDSNVAGASGTIQSGLGTGTGTASSLIFQTPTVAASGSTVQTQTTRLTLNANGAEVADDAYAGTWDNNLSVPTKNAVYDKINTMSGGTLTAKGYLTSNQPTTSGTAVNVTGMSFAIAASEVWSFQFNLVAAVSAAGASHKFAIDVPTGCTVGAQVRGSSGTAVISADATLGAGVMSTSTGGVIISGTVQNGANAGTVQLQFASGDGVNTATVTGNGSFFTATKMN